MVSPSVSRTLRWLAGIDDDDQAQPPPQVSTYNDPAAGGTVSQPLPVADAFAADQGPWEQPYPGTVTPIRNPDRSVTTERSITVTEPELNEGRATNIPTVWSGRVVPDDEAITNASYAGAGRFPAYPSIDEAVSAAEQRSRDLGAGRATSVGGAVVPPDVIAGRSDAPQTLPAASEPTPTPWSLPDIGTGVRRGLEAAGGAIGQGLSAVGQGISDVTGALGSGYAANRQAVLDANAGRTGGVDVGTPIRQAYEAVSPYIQPAGGAPEMGGRLRLINDIAARDQGRPGDVRAMFTAAEDPAWRAQNPELADEYDRLQQGYGLTVMGQAGDLPRVLGRAGEGLAAAARGVGTRVTGALDANAERVAAADARMAAEGSTAAPGVFGAVPEEYGRPYPPIRGDVGGVVREHLGEPSAEMLADSRYPRDVVHPDLRAAGIGPEITPQIDLSGRMNAAAGTVPVDVPVDRLAAVNRVLGQGVASTISGGVTSQVNQQLNPDDPYAGLKGFAAGALVPPLAARGGMALARRAGREAELGPAARIGLGDVPPSRLREPTLPGMEPPYVRPQIPDVSAVPNRPPVLGDVPPSAMRSPQLPGLEAPPPRPIGEAAEAMRVAPEQLAQFPGVQKALSGAEQRAAVIARKGLTRPSAWDWLKAAGYSGIYSPATAVSSLIGGAQELIGAQPKEAIRALVQGRPGAYASQARAQVGATGEGLTNLGKVLVGGDAGAAAARSGGSQGTAGLSERVRSPWAYAAARILEKPGEILTEAPDALLRPAFLAQGTQREARTIAAELGHTGAAAKAYADRLVADVASVQAGQIPTMPDTHRVIDAAKAYADQLGYKGQPGQIGQYLSKLSKQDNAVGVLASFLIPFPGMASRVAEQAARVTPGVGLLPAVRRGQASRFDVAYDQAFGTLAASGMAYWAMNGGITGSGPADPEKRQEMIAQGWQPNSVLVAGHYIPNRMFQKFQPMLDTAGELHDALAYGKADRTAPDIASDLVKRASRIATDQVGLSGLADLHDMLTQGFASQFPGFAARSIVRYLPYGGVARSVASATDPLSRRADPWREGSPLPQIGEQLETAIPGLRQDVPAAQDVLGQPMENPQYGLRAFAPRVTSVRSDPTISRFQDAGVDITAPKTAISDDGVTVDLSPEETRRWNELRGQALITATQRMIDSGVLDRLPPARAKERLEEARADAADRADAALRREIGGAEFSRRRREARARAAR